MLCGVTTGSKAPTSLHALYWNHVTVLGSTMGSDDGFRAMLAAVKAAGLEPVVDRTYPLTEALAALERMERGEQFG